MTAEKTSVKLDSRPDPWAITDKLRAQASQARTEIEKARENFENLTIPCPKDGTDSKFQRYEGAFPVVKGVFKCKRGDEFFY